ncbi:ATP-binding protein [Cryobacterium sp. PH29-G1]|uniref:ATP-binding protein n=1 Tax=Cryobacterium sp. PH29-G1 TaxID=3046211 RepID=UPI0024BBE5C9|nr:ATP-binding protein [Cryobacterium sp. PH29-G1]MDJ0350027.1 ATP-binding protein [Cryobacterium sp. PH29-G1]
MTNLGHIDHAQRLRVERSVFISQLLVTGATLLLLGVAGLFNPGLFANSLFLAGVLIVFLATGLAAAIPWRRISKNWVVVLPLLDIVGLVTAREGEPLMGTTFLLVLPVIWLSTHYRGVGAAGSVIVTTVLLWTAGVVRAEPLSSEEIPRLAIVPIVLVFVAVTTYTTTRRAAAQRVLLTQQSVLFESALRRSRRQEQTLDEIFNTVDFGVIGFDRNARPNLVNRAQHDMFEQFGVRGGDVSKLVIYHTDQVTPFAAGERPFERARRGETVDRTVFWIGEQGTQQSAVLASARPILDENDQYDGAVLISRDVTAELRAVKARDDLVASVSHELRTPLTSIMGYLELALDDNSLDGSTRRMLEVATKNSDRLLTMVSDLLTTASAAGEGLHLHLAPCDLAVIVHDAAEAIRPMATNRSIAVVVRDLPPVLLTADAFRLRQVIDNLFSNAVKYNIARGVITVALVDIPDHIEIRMTDTGRGMTPDEQTNLFDRFYRADSVRGSSVHGTGLGLNISRDICRQHGGDLRLESTPGRGTTAIMTLPRPS